MLILWHTSSPVVSTVRSAQWLCQTAGCVHFHVQFIFSMWRNLNSEAGLFFFLAEGIIIILRGDCKLILQTRSCSCWNVTSSLGRHAVMRLPAEAFHLVEMCLLQTRTVTGSLSHISLFTQGWVKPTRTNSHSSGRFALLCFLFFCLCVMLRLMGVNQGSNQGWCCYFLIENASRWYIFFKLLLISNRF